MQTEIVYELIFKLSYLEKWKTHMQNTDIYFQPAVFLSPLIEELLKKQTKMVSQIQWWLENSYQSFVWIPMQTSLYYWSIGGHVTDVLTFNKVSYLVFEKHKENVMPSGLSPRITNVNEINCVQYWIVNYCYGGKARINID